MERCLRRHVGGCSSLAYWLLVVGWLGQCVVTEQRLFGQTPSAAAPPSFEADIRPIFREFCFDCHGATAELKGGMDLRLVRFLKRGGDSGPAIEPGQPAESYLLSLVADGDMPPGEARVPEEKVAVIARWLAAGAPTLRPEPETLGPGIPLSEEDRNYWAYQQIVPPDLSQLPNQPDSKMESAIDQLVQAAMPDGLHLSPEADRLTLIKRAYFTLLGLPPSQAEVQQWLSHPSPDWFEQMVDVLLESPHYGERWARHWLDVAGYADSEGYTEADTDRPWAWKYRDYVIRSFNSDKGLDQFIVEQLAGDELAGAKQGDWTPEQIELLTATGFLRLAADGTGSGDNSPEARNKTIADTLKIVGTSLLGSSLHCAQCHDHRYDPISHLDYTAIRSVFEPALDWQNWQVPNARLVSLYTEQDREQAAAIESEAQAIAEQKQAKQAEYMLQALNKELEKYDEPLREQLRAAYQTEAKQRDAAQQALLARYPSVNISPGVLYQYLPEAAEDLKKFDQRIAEVRSRKPVEEFVRTLSEPAGHAPVSRLFHRGEYQQPLQEVPPAALTVTAPEGESPEFPVDDPALPTSGRRLAFAKWLVDPANPLVARVLVNRVWLHHFGKGIVETPAEFGRLGSLPTHPQLLDWLAADLIEHGWSLKHLHRTLMTSRVWRQASQTHAEGQVLDPENRFLWRKPLQRLDAEIIRDRMLAAVGRLDCQPFGPPLAIKEDDTGQVIVDGTQARRSLYIRARRTQPVAMLQAFDAPVMDINCEYRPVSTVATQSLMLLNGEFCLQQAEQLAERATVLSKTQPGAWERPLPELPIRAPTGWSYASGRYDPATQQVVDYAPLAFWENGRWQGGPSVPAAETGWAFLHAQGGHPGNPQYATVRRWTADRAGSLELACQLQHHSEHGDGVRARLVSSRAGLVGEWLVQHGSVDTSLRLEGIEPGETIDFVVDCLEHETSDSFTWPIEFRFVVAGQPDQTIHAQQAFRGPDLTAEELASQVSHAWQLAFCRPPLAEELDQVLRFAAEQLSALRSDARGVPAGSTAERQVLVNVCQMLFNANEFLYVD